ncbi:hypothetical protein AB4Z42_09385 [Mycobacterium sp. 2YAF39]|uniref:hypothetical protein n=1 Tax=Mycobacterium sp. 2YAF39 TaxID=3233033 RepID=UPI003F9B3ADC
MATAKLYFRSETANAEASTPAFLISLPARRPGETPYLIADNFALHQRREVRDRCADSWRCCPPTRPG